MFFISLHIVCFFAILLCFNCSYFANVLYLSFCSRLGLGVNSSVGDSDPRVSVVRIERYRAM